jgi:hypothetical protein
MRWCGLTRADETGSSTQTTFDDIDATTENLKEVPTNALANFGLI